MTSESARSQFKPSVPSVELLRRRLVSSDVTALMVGTISGQAVLLVGSPLLTRLYSPAEIGGFAVFLGITGTLGVAGSLGYQLAIPLPGNRRLAANVAALAALILGGVSVLTTVLGLAARWGPPVWGQFGSTLAPLLWLIGPCLLAVGGYQVLFYWTTREGGFRDAGVARMAQAVAQIVVQVGAALIGLGVFGLVAAYVLAQFVGIGRLWNAAGWPTRAVTRPRMSVAAKRYRKFPQFTMWASLANAAGTQLPAVFAGALFGLTAAGHLALTLRVLALPAALLGQAFAQVFYPKAAALVGNRDALRRLVKRTAGALLLVSLVCFVPVMVLGRDLFPLVFGKEWQDSGDYSRWIAAWSAIALLSSPVSTLALLMGRQGTGFVFSVADASLKAIALLAGSWLGGPAAAVPLFAMAGAVTYVVYFGWTLHLVEVNLAGWIFPYSTHIVLIVGATLVCAWARPFIPVLPLWAALTSICALITWRPAIRLIIGEQSAAGPRS